jgi:guanylate kinase
VQEYALAPIFVITGPSGVGKGTLVAALRERIPEIELSVSATTRSPRPGEKHGRDYYFLSDDEFEEYVREGRFVEHANYSNNRYGTTKAELESRRVRDKPVVLEIELQGARQLRKTVPEAIQIFIAPPSTEALKDRLTERGTDSPPAVQTRLKTAQQELAAQKEFKYVVLNDRLEDAVDELERLARKELAEG